MPRQTLGVCVIFRGSSGFDYRLCDVDGEASRQLCVPGERVDVILDDVLRHRACVPIVGVTCAELSGSEISRVCGCPCSFVEIDWNACPRVEIDCDAFLRKTCCPRFYGGVHLRHVSKSRVDLFRHDLLPCDERLDSWQSLSDAIVPFHRRRETVASSSLSFSVRP